MQEARAEKKFILETAVDLTFKIYKRSTINKRKKSISVQLRESMGWLVIGIG
jgi:hypothetical protein